jgi:hypothetical protein
MSFIGPTFHSCIQLAIRALSAHSATEFNISPGRGTAIWPVAIVSTQRSGKMDRNDCYTQYVGTLGH